MLIESKILIQQQPIKLLNIIYIFIFWTKTKKIFKIMKKIKVKFLFLIIIFQITISITNCSENKTSLNLNETKSVKNWSNFNEFKLNLGRKYSHVFEEVRSRRAFYENIKIITEHNELYKEGKVSYRLRANIMADLKAKSYLEKYVRLVNSKRFKELDPTDNLVSSSLNENLPNEIDWRNNGFITSADNQGKCGSCYAFSIVRSMEGQVFKRTGKLLQLSVQQVLDCSIKTGNKGCSGGSLRNTLMYLEETGGLMRNNDYTYQERQGKCQFIETLSVVNVTTWSILPPKDEDSLKAAVALLGPIAVSLNASPNTFQLYGDGVYDDPACSDTKVNHAMLVLGYTEDYWILKNWWGPEWGENGFMKLKRGKNLCGISNYAAYALV